MTKKINLEKEQRLVTIIEKAKKDLLKLKSKQKNEIGALACQFNLNELDCAVLENEFKEISRKHNLA